MKIKQRRIGLLWPVIFLVSAISAAAQNPVCPTRPSGDSTNACASTAFVQQAVGVGGITIGVTPLHGGTNGSVLFDNNGVVGEKIITGTVSTVSVTTVNGVSGSVINPTTTPAISLTLGAITPSSVAIGAGSAITSSGPGGVLGTGAFASAYTLPTATSSVLGGVKPDGTTITNSAGAISVTYGTSSNTAAQGNDSRITGPAAVNGAIKSNGSGVFGQAACSDLSNAGTACPATIGTSGATVPLLSTANTWSLSQTFASGTSVGAATGNRAFVVGGGATNFGEGASVQFQNAGTFVGLVGNIDVGIPSAYSSTIGIYSVNNIGLYGTGTRSCSNGLATDANGVLSCVTATSTVSGYYTLQYIAAAWGCTNPAGGVVPIAGSTTSGLQECLNAMVANKTGNFRAICPSLGSVAIIASTTVTFPASSIVNYDLNGCMLTTSATQGVLVDSMPLGARIDWGGGMIYCTNATVDCLIFYPNSPDPVFSTYGIGYGFFKFPTILAACSSNGAFPRAIRFDSNGGVAGSHVAAIYGSKFEFSGVDGFDGTHNCFVYGIYTDTPTNTYAAFGQNNIYAGYIQGISSVPVSNGTSAVTQATQSLATNTWVIGSIGTSGTISAAFLTYGFDDNINVNISPNSGTIAIGIDFSAATANGNYFVAPQIDATTPIADSGATVLNIGIYKGLHYN